LIKRIALALIVGAGITFVLAVAWRLFGFRISDRALLREAVREYEKSTIPSEQIVFWDAFCQQAAQGYYDDAMKTILLSHRDGETQYALISNRE
jgi:hypothetical protein